MDGGFKECGAAAALGHLNAMTCLNVKLFFTSGAANPAILSPSPAFLQFIAFTAHGARRRLTVSSLPLASKLHLVNNFVASRIALLLLYAPLMSVRRAGKQVLEIHVNKFLKFGLMAATFCSFVEAASAAPDVVKETRQVDERVVRVKLDGLVDMSIRQGSPARLVVVGDPRWVQRTSTVQHGDTLNIDTDAPGGLSNRFVLHAMSPLRVELTLPNLREVSSETIGSTEVVGFSGDELDLTHDGAGAMTVRCDYKRLTANLGGIGGMTIKGLNSEGVELNLRGAGSVSLSGRSKWLRADLGGVGGLSAKQFEVDSVDLDLSGLGNATVTAHQNANLNLSGMGSVTVYGKPANRKFVIDGLGKVSWK